MWIKGFVHEDIDCAFVANVQIVSKKTADYRAGEHVGFMEFTDGTDAKVYKHPAGTYYGYIAQEV